MDQISLGVAKRIEHDILATLIWAPDAPDRVSKQRQSAGPADRYSNQFQSINNYFRQDIESRFVLNKKPDNIGVLIRTMKNEWSSGGSTQGDPNRLIMFNGASDYYGDFYKTPSGQYWKTGWRDGSSFNPLQAEKDGMTICESFDVSQGGSSS